MSDSTHVCHWKIKKYLCCRKTDPVQPTVQTYTWGVLENYWCTNDVRSGRKKVKKLISSIFHACIDWPKNATRRLDNDGKNLQNIFFRHHKICLFQRFGILVWKSIYLRNTELNAQHNEKVLLHYYLSVLTRKYPHSKLERIWMQGTSLALSFV